MICDRCLDAHSDTVPCSERNYLAEAFAILDGTSALLPERAHLQALIDEGRPR